MQGTAEHRREREKGVLVYPVYSRRSGGLSVGINLFPDHKVCSFDCPYCEVFPFKSRQVFSLSLMEEALAEELKAAKERDIPVRDICFSGSGEPTISPWFPAALEAVFRIRDREAVDVVLITNGSGLLDDALFDLLCRAAERGLCIWLKLDAGTPEWYRVIDRSEIPFQRLIGKIRAFVQRAPVTLQTMVCAVNGVPPPPQEARAWDALVAELAFSAAELRGVQIYGKARAAPEDPLAESLPTGFLEARAASLAALLKPAGKEGLVRVYP
ncbi:MAG: hypothetical protein FWB99_00895 [Treponema sp.]|nr:hypothetical protein [Treponema sp.]